MDKKVTLAQLKEVVQEAYDQVKTNTGGKNADYIPYLANVNKDLFGISVCLLNGQTIHVGDTDYRFGIESVSKVHTAILALRQYGAKEILDKIGADATGLPFNSIIAILLENDHPSTPLVNAGAISACSMVQPIGDSAKKWDAIVGNVTDLCGSAPQLIDELYKSESDTNFNNRSIAWLLKNYNRIYDDPDMSLDLYTRQCSLGVTALQLSIAAMCGVGLGITFNYNGSTGGTDIIAAIVNKYKDVSLGRMIMICDVFIISSCYFIFHDWRRVIFGFVTLFIIGVVLDWIINSARQSVQFFIFSKKYDEIADRIIKDADRGVTVLDGTGWYSKNNVKVLVVLAKKRQSLDIFRLVKRIDPNAFISQSSVIGVYGEGFDKLKVK